jgi:hypothetical protein
MSISGIVQATPYESQYSNLTFTVGLQEGNEYEQYVYEGSEWDNGSNAGSTIYLYNWSNIAPFPLAQHNYEGPGDESVLFLVTATTSVTQMVTIANAPAYFNVQLNNSSSTVVSVINPTLNVIRLN